MNSSATKRRTLGESLGATPLSAQADAFLRGEAAPEPRPPLAVLTPPATPPGATSDPATPANECPFRRPAAPPPEPLPVSTRPGGLASITVRLPAGLAETLLRVSLERRLRRERPCAQQDIVAEALRAWLEIHEGAAARSVGE